MGNDDNGNFNPKTSSGTDARIYSSAVKVDGVTSFLTRKLAPNMKPMKAKDTKWERAERESRGQTKYYVVNTFVTTVRWDRHIINANVNHIITIMCTPKIVVRSKQINWSNFVIEISIYMIWFCDFRFCWKIRNPILSTVTDEDYLLLVVFYSLSVEIAFSGSWWWISDVKSHRKWEW